MGTSTLATLRTIADLHGLPWSDADLQAALPAVTAALTMLAALDTVPLPEAAEPALFFRAL